MTDAPERIRLTKAETVTKEQKAARRRERAALNKEAMILAGADQVTKAQLIAKLAGAEEKLANSEELRAQIVVAHEDLKRELADTRAYGERVRLQVQREADDRRLRNGARTEGVLLLGAMLAGAILLMALGAYWAG